MNNQSRSYVYALLTVLFWSTVASAFKIALRDLNYIQLLFVANFISLVVFLVVVSLQGKWRQIGTTRPAQWLMSALQGLLNPFGYYILLLQAYTLLPAQVAQPVNFVWPITLMLLSVPLLKQPIRLTGFLALFISFAGVLVLSSQGSLSEFRVKEPLGIALALASSLVWALFWIVNLKDKRDDVIKLLLSTMFSFVYVFILARVTGNTDHLITKPLFAAVYVGVFEMGITFFFWLKALQLSHSTDRVSNLVYLTPFVSLVFIHFILGERLYYTSVIGLCLIVGGILIRQIKKANR